MIMYSLLLVTFSENAYTSVLPGSPWGWINRAAVKKLKYI